MPFLACAWADPYNSRFNREADPREDGIRPVLTDAEFTVTAIEEMQALIDVAKAELAAGVRIGCGRGESADAEVCG